jgi:hypothetical protein
MIKIVQEKNHSNQIIKRIIPAWPVGRVQDEKDPTPKRRAHVNHRKYFTTSYFEHCRTSYIKHRTSYIAHR